MLRQLLLLFELGSWTYNILTKHADSYVFDKLDKEKTRRVVAKNTNGRNAIRWDRDG